MLAFALGLLRLVTLATATAVQQAIVVSFAVNWAARSHVISHLAPFFRKQWTAKAHSRRCKDCVVAAGAEDSQSEKPKQAGTNGAGSTSGGAEKKEESELCALVRAILFANPQWGLKKVTKEVASKMRDLGRSVRLTLRPAMQPLGSHSRLLPHLPCSPHLPPFLTLPACSPPRTLHSPHPPAPSLHVFLAGSIPALPIHKQACSACVCCFQTN
eukprot:3872671-Rhodomonas_salina.2